LRSAPWAFLRPMLSPRLAELHRDAFVIEDAATAPSTSRPTAATRPSTNSTSTSTPTTPPPPLRRTLPKGPPRTPGRASATCRPSSCPQGYPT
jgi:hypothetical protein